MGRRPGSGEWAKLGFGGWGLNWGLFFCMKSCRVGRTIKMWERSACSWPGCDVSFCSLGGKAGREVQVTGGEKK